MTAERGCHAAKPERRFWHDRREGMCHAAKPENRI